ncbi:MULTISPECIES: class I SAM-dependent methyltransferase [unclassified Dehalobacter]|uniref:class I SAM-dependent methyltransferase n=1 Tax=unclassified Dehalobacter TaxID=2635733 RepID=UPI000E6CE7D0|nr:MULTISPECIES: class I SAM-dependent methyltransferase [unclassified Dehalobacter]RJE47204.1 methyltransferase [Dehalobacter sp. MCB1]TCX53550.1 class I SAM-dependent methyltransferase [Dehalobacter sp. 14DCB1]TCX54935.1 class I SAM-dependent methyltransferase [Dehalobacter sp. 12DCB1]
MEELVKHASVFNRIAPIYNWYFRQQVKDYRSLINCYDDLFQIPSAGKVLDIGCGTGALLYSLAERGYLGTGVDFSDGMLRAAKKSTQDRSIAFVQADVTQGLDFPEKSFDLVLAFYVLHGLSSGLRQKIYAEASRLSRGRILFYDYNQKRRLLTDIAEWAEGGDYFEFVRHGADEMKAFFSHVEVIDAGIQTAFYVCSSK